MSVLLAIVLFVVVVILIPIVQSLLANEAKGWLPYAAPAVVRSAARRLPPTHRERYEEEWLAELAAYDNRPLTALIRACWIHLEVRELRSVLGEGVSRVSLTDRLVAGVMLLVLAPLCLVVMLAIALDTRGPPILRSSGVRPDGRPFDRLRFRTRALRHAVAFDERRVTAFLEAVDRRLEPLNYPSGGHWSLPRYTAHQQAKRETSLDAYWARESSYWAQESFAQEVNCLLAFMVSNPLPEPPLTRVGRFLSRWGLDELPVLINVLRGEMAMPYPWRGDPS